jgi:hypothetical protein
MPFLKPWLLFKQMEIGALLMGIKLDSSELLRFLSNILPLVVL